MALAEYSNQNKKDKPESVEGVRNELVKILSSIKVSSLELKNKAVILDAAITPKEAIEMMVKNKVRAAPVLDGDNFVGVLDLKDTLQYVLEVYQKLYNTDENENDNVDEKAPTTAIDFFVGDHSQMTHQKLEDLCKHRPFRVLNASDSLLQLASVFALGSHVVGVVDDKKLVAVCTQGFFFQFVAKKWNFAHACSLSKIFDLGYITTPIQTVKASTKAVEAFKLMTKHNLSGLAVINDNGILIHNTSATDVKLWLLKGEQSLDDSIELFLINIRNLSLQERYPITVCQLDDSFKRAIQKLQATRYHRLWIVDHETKPIGVLALTDIFRFIVGSKEKEKEDDKNKNEDEQKTK